MILLENAVDQLFICKVALNKSVIFKLLQLCKASFLDANTIIIVHVVQTDYLGIRLSGQDTLGKVGADKTRRIGDENFHKAISSILSIFYFRLKDIISNKYSFFIRLSAPE